LDIAALSSQQEVPSSYVLEAFVPETKLVEVDFEFKPGFKIGVGFEFGCDNWDFYAEYTRFHSTVSNSASADNGALIITNAPLYTGLDAQTASGKWKLEMDYIDLFLRREFWVGNCLTLRPALGLRINWFDQNFNLSYDRRGATELTFIEGLTTNTKSNNKGVGFTVGLHSNWMFCSGFRLYGDLFTSLLYADYDNRVTLYYEGQINVQVPLANLVFNSCPDYIRPSMEISMGLGWADYFCCNDWYLDLSIGYDFKVFWSQKLRGVDDIRTVSGKVYDDLFLHGLNISAKLFF